MRVNVPFDGTVAEPSGVVVSSVKVTASAWPDVK